MTALNHDPVYGATQHTAYASVNTATAIAATDLDDSPSNAVLLMTAPAGGAVVTRCKAIQRQPGTATASQVNLYLSKDGGTTLRLLSSQAAAAYTWAVTTAPVPVDFGYSESAPLRLEATDRLYGQARNATAVTDCFAFTAEYTDLVPDA
jgi:hypothetical protein